jgi:hypothetical protein
VEAIFNKLFPPGILRLLPDSRMVKILPNDREIGIIPDSRIIEFLNERY